jgi:hypothetical protein
METNTTPTCKIRWEKFYDGMMRDSNYLFHLYWVGYLDGEEGADCSYLIRIVKKTGQTMYRLSGYGLKQSTDFPTIEAAKAYAEEREANK